MKKYFRVSNQNVEGFGNGSGHDGAYSKGDFGTGLKSGSPEEGIAKVDLIKNGEA